MSEIDTNSVLSRSAFKAGDVVQVTHPLFSGNGTISAPLWMENFLWKAGEPEHYLVWAIDPIINGYDWPGILHIIDPMYGFDELGKRITKAGEDGTVALRDVASGVRFRLREKLLGVSCGESLCGVVLAEKPDPLFYNGVCVQFDESDCVSVVHGRTRIIRLYDEPTTATPPTA